MLIGYLDNLHHFVGGLGDDDDIGKIYMGTVAGAPVSAVAEAMRFVPGGSLAEHPLQLPEGLVEGLLIHHLPLISTEVVAQGSHYTTVGRGRQVREQVKALAPSAEGRGRMTGICLHLGRLKRAWNALKRGRAGCFSLN